MNLAEQIIVAGLQGIKSPNFAGSKFMFVAELGDEYPVIGEGESVFDALLDGIKRGIELDGEIVEFARDVDDPSEWSATKDLPIKIQETNNAGLISFLLDMQFCFDFLTATDDFQDDPYFQGILRNFDGTKFVFGWSASPPRQEEAFAVLEVVGEKSNEETTNE